MFMILNLHGMTLQKSYFKILLVTLLLLGDFKQSQIPPIAVAYISLMTILNHLFSQSDLEQSFVQGVGFTVFVDDFFQVSFLCVLFPVKDTRILCPYFSWAKLKKTHSFLHFCPDKTGKNILFPFCQDKTGKSSIPSQCSI